MTLKDALDEFEAHIKKHVAIYFNGNKKYEDDILFGTYRSLASCPGDESFRIRVIQNIKDYYFVPLE